MGAIAKAEEAKAAAQKQPSINTIMNNILDGEGMRKRFNDLLGDRAPQFVSSVISLVNANKSLQKAMVDDPLSVIQAALKAATFDLPIEPSLGYAYIVPVHNHILGIMTASFVIGYKGMEQLCLRTGVYSRVPDAVDVRQGELVSYDRLTGDAEFRWIEDEDEREKLPIIGYAGYFRLKNGAEKTIYMTQKQIAAHELKNRKGERMGKGWKDNWDEMAKKTIIRRLCGRYGLMSIAYRDFDAAITNIAQAILEDDTPAGEIIIDSATGEVTE